MKKSTYKPEAYTKEAKKARFYRVGERRVNKVLHYFRLIGNISNGNLYCYTDREVKKMFLKLRKELTITENKFKVFRNTKFKFQ